MEQNMLIEKMTLESQSFSKEYIDTVLNSQTLRLTQLIDIDKDPNELTIEQIDESFLILESLKKNEWFIYKFRTDLILKNYTLNIITKLIQAKECNCQVS
jgi:hypothetical protein